MKEKNEYLKDLLGVAGMAALVGITWPIVRPDRSPLELHALDICRWEQPPGLVAPTVGEQMRDSDQPFTPAPKTINRRVYVGSLHPPEPVHVIIHRQYGKPEE